MKIYKLKPIGNKQFGRFHFHETTVSYLVYEIEPVSHSEARCGNIAFGYGRACIYFWEPSVIRYRRKYYSASLFEDEVDFSYFNIIDENSEEWIEFQEKFIVDKTKNLLVKA